MKREKIIVIDGNSLLNRAFYALPPLTNSEGLHTNAVYGFTNMLIKIINDEQPDYIATAFDRKAPTFRHTEYSDYKAGRKKMPVELEVQFPLVKDILKAFKIGIFELDGFEADDIIGTVSKICEDKGMDVLIYTGDKDALQLVTDNIKVAISRRGITEIDVYDISAFEEKYEVKPISFIDIKGLMGDQSDNIPGVPGIGEKTAIKLIKEFGSIENLIENHEKISGKKVKELVEEYREQALFSKKLATICLDTPIEFELEEIKNKYPDKEALISLFKRLEFKTLINKIPSQDKEDKGTGFEIKEYPKVSLSVLDDLIRSIKDKKKISLVFNLRGSDFYNTEIEGMAISLDGENAVYIPADKKLILGLKEILEDESIKKLCHNAKDGYVSLHKFDVTLKGMEFDAAIAAYLLNPSESTYNTDDLVRIYLKEDIPSEKEISDMIKGGNIKVKSNYLCTKAIYIYNLEDILKEQLEANAMYELYNKVEHPLIEVLASMEILGFAVDEDILNVLSGEFGDEIDRLTKEIYESAGEIFNINSPKQLGAILFDKLNLPVIKKTKTGYSTDAEVLEKLAPQHEIVSKILEYRQIAKLKSTYVDGLLNIIKEDKKIHSNFNQTVTATGRISSTEPNLQNIPVKVLMGKKIRKAFVASSDEYLILSADYSQIELRVLAHISRDENLIDAFHHKLDIHKKTASEVFNVPLDEVTPFMRSSAKAVNFGIVYGISDYGLSVNLNISRKEAKSYIDNYLNKYEGVKNYMDNIIAFAKKNGYVTTELKRKRYIPEINSTNFNIRSLGERLAMNTPIQGTAADIIKIAMVKVYSELQNRNLKSRLILQVHDELIIEVHKDEIEEVKSILKNNMENAMQLNVPLEVDINMGKSWFDAK
ncbi:DNA polymerase I [Oxobacter pfennigii]|uniref:DNA polymerase I n=1 Tax=Oxobacter pfennigii TaxID=36849 RepID=A0A0N8NSK1_9CLOT|nr:DNA polymerase I [Oxobacter pfennigii]KPU42256.1 DNA polymerase I [Oxobacter pfennigii]